MRHSITRQFVGQHGTSRPPRASSGTVPAQNVPSTPPQAQLPMSGVNPVTQAPAYTPALHAPVLRPSSVCSPPEAYATPAPAHLAYSCSSQIDPNALAVEPPSDLGKRVLMDYLALVQSQLAAVNQVVASTVAQNQALAAQNQALLEELRLIKHQVQALTGPYAGTPLVSEGPPMSSGGPQLSVIAVTQPQLAVAASAVASEVDGLATREDAAAEAAIPALNTAAVATTGIAQTAQPPQPLLRHVPLLSSGPTSKPVHQAMAQPQPSVIIMSETGSESSAPAILPASDADAPVEGENTHLQLLSRVASELASLTEVPITGTGSPVQATEELRSSRGATAVTVSLSASMSLVTEQPQSIITKSEGTATIPAAIAPNGYAAVAMPAGTVAPPQGARLPGRGGRYVGPPRAGPYTRGVQRITGTGASGVATPSLRAEDLMDGAQASTGAAADITAAGASRRAAAGNKSSDAVSGSRTAITIRGGKPIAAGSVGAISGAAACPGDGAVNASSGPNIEAGNAIVEPLALSTAGTAAAAMEKRIRLCSTAKELQAIIEEDRLSLPQAVFAARQLPRIARLVQERQQELLEDSTRDKDAEAELMALRELFLRLMARFSSPNALASLRSSLLPHYLALAAVSGELHQPPSRAFASALRQLVTQHVAEVAPDVAAAAVALVAQVDGTVAPGVLERACKVVTEGKTRLVDWKALVAAGQLAPLGRVAVEAAQQVLKGAEVSFAVDGASVEGGLDAETVLAAAQGVLACSAAGLTVPPVLLRPLEAACRRDGVLAAMGPSGQLLVARAFVAAGYHPEDTWLDVWEPQAVACLPRASPVQVVALAAVMHALARVGAAHGSGRPRRDFVAAASQRLLSSSISAGVTSGVSACAFAQHIGELSSGANNGTTVAAAAPPHDATRLAAALLSIATASLASLDLPDLAALVSGLSLLDVRAPAEVWSTLLSRATDTPAAAAVATAAAWRALELGLPPGIKPASLEHFLSVVGKHVGELPAASLVGLLGLAAAVNGKLRPGLVAVVLTRLYDQAAALGPRDAAFLFAAIDALSLPLTQPLAARMLALAGGKEKGGCDAADAAASVTPAMVLYRTAEAVLVPERVLAALGLERTAQLLELVARLQQTVTATMGPTLVPGEGSAGPAPVVADVVDSLSGDGCDNCRLMPRGHALELLRLLQPLLPEASPKLLATVVSSAAVLELSVQPDWLAAIVANTISAAPLLDPMTWSRIAAALTRCERLAGMAPGSAGGHWLDVFVDDIQCKLAAAPPPALALTLQVLVLHGRLPSASWTTAFLAAAMPSLEAPLPLTQAQAAGAAAAAASIAAGRARPAGRNPAAGSLSSFKAHFSSPAASVATTSSKLPQAPAIGTMQGPIASAFTPQQLSQLLSGLAALQLRQYITPAWLAVALRQVEGRAVHFTYRDLTEALYGIVCLGGCVRDAVCNQLFIISLAKMSTAPPTLLARTLAVAAAAEGRRVSPRWWEEAQRAIVAKLSGTDAALKASAADDIGAATTAAAAAWQTSDLSLLVESVLTLHRQKGDATITDALATALAEAVSRDGAAVAAALSPDAAVSYVEACGKIPQLGRPPLLLLEQYLSCSIRLLAKFAAADDRQAVDLADLAKVKQQSEPSSSGKRGAREKRERKRARERVTKQAAVGAVAVASPLLEHLQSAIAVGRILVATPNSERPTTAPQWLAVLAAAGAVAARSLPVTCAADMLWLLVKLDGGAGGVAAAAEGPLALVEQVHALVARVGGWAADASGAAEKAQQSTLAPDKVVDTVWALQALGFTPSEGLLQGLARALPGRMATLSPAEALPLLKALCDGGAAGVRAVAEADATASAAAGPGRAAAAGAGGGAAVSVSAPVKLATELGRYLDVHLPDLSDSDLVMAMAFAAKLDLKLPPAVTAGASTRLARAAMAGVLRGETLLQGVLSLNKHGAKPPPEQLEPLCDAVAESALDGTLGGMLQIANAAAAVYDMGARPGPEWLGMVGEAVLDDLACGTSSHGSVRRPPLTARGLIIALHDLSTRFSANYVTLAMAACRAAMDDLEGQLAAAQGILVPQPLQQRPEWGWMVPMAPTNATNLGVCQSQKLGNDDDDEGVGVSEEVMGLDPELLESLRLADIVQLLTGLVEARQGPPEAFWELLERVLRPSLQHQQQLHSSTSAVGGEGGSGAPVLLHISDGELCELLVAMQRLSNFASKPFLQDLEGYLGRRMPLQGHRMLAFFSFHCVTRGYTPEPKFMRLFLQRVEEVLSQVDTQSALLLMQFLLAEAVMSGPQGTERPSDAGRTLEKRKVLLQGLLECTEGQELLMFANVAEGDSRSLVIELISLIGNFGLRPPHATSSERRAAWLTAMQALTLGCMDHVGWDHVATLLWIIRGSGHTPEGEWLTAFYKGLQASAATAAPHEVAAAAIAMGKCGFVTALAPTLPARLAAVLETRMREFASADPRVISQLLSAVGEMGHTVRTEVLQAAEVLLEQPLARAPEVLREAHVALSASAPSARTVAEAEAENRLMAAASAAEELLCEENLLTSCKALWIHGYRPGPQLADALMSAAGILHCGTQQLLQEMQATGWRSGPQLIWPSLSWSNLTGLGIVLTVLADWGVQPTEQWRDEAATALVALAMFGGQQQEETALITEAVAALERLGRQLSEQEVLALQHAVEVRQYDCQVDQRVMQMANTFLENKRAKSVARGHGAGAEAAPMQQPVQQLYDGHKAAWPGRRAASSEVVAPMVRNSLEFGDVAFTAAAGMLVTGPAAQEAPQQGPLAPADYRDLNASLAHGNRQIEFSERPTDVGQPLQHQGGSDFVALSEAAKAIVAAVNAFEHEVQTSASTTTDGTATEAMVMPVEAEVATVVSMAREPAVAQMQEVPVVGPAPVPAGITSASSPPRRSAAENVEPADMTPLALQSSEPAVDAPSTRVPFRRMTPAERTAAGMRLQRAAPPAPPTYPDGTTDESMHLAISQLLQFLPQSSRPPRMATKVAHTDNNEDGNGLSGGDDDSAAAATATGTASQLAPTMMDRVKATSAGAPKSRISRTAAGKAGRGAAAGTRARPIGFEQRVARPSTAITGPTTVGMPAVTSGPATTRAGALDPQDPRTWNLLDGELDNLVDNGALAHHQPGSGVLPVVEPTVLEP